MKLYELFEAVRDQYLYHATDTDAAVGIIMDDIIKGNTEHDTKIKGGHLFAHRPSDANEFGKVRGVSLTRSKKFAINWKSGDGVVFVLDGEKLKQRYRMAQIDYYGNRREAEEFVFGDIKNVSSYIVAIIINKRTYDYLMEYNKKIIDDPYGPLLNHPKLQITKPIIKEGYAHIIKPLSDIVNELLSKIDANIRAERPITVSRLLSNDFIETMYDKYGKRFGEFCEFVNKIDIIIYREHNGSTFASYVFSDYSTIELYMFLQLMFPDVDVDVPITPRMLRNNLKVKSSLLHELRHAMQSKEFKTFFMNRSHAQTSKLNKFDYKTDPIEIDAAFTHIMFETSLDQPIKSFVEEVMRKFSDYKKLTHKQFEHYYRNEAKYYTQHKTVYDKSHYNLTPQERLEKKKNDKLSADRDTLLSLIDLDIIPKDLREIGFKGNTFLFDKSYQLRYRGALSSLLLPENKTNFNELSETNTALIVWYLAVLNKSFKNEGRDVSKAIKLYFDISKTDINKAIDILNNFDNSRFRYSKKYSAKLMKELQEDMNR